jgi:hypothetical protein
MSNANRIRLDELYTKAEAIEVLGQEFLDTLRKQFGLQRLGTNQRAFYFGSDILEAMRRHATEKTAS